MARTYEFIASASPTTASGTFSSIPQTYTDLIIVVKARVTSGWDIFSFRPNGTASGYNQTYIESNNSVLSAGRGSAEIAYRCGYIPGTSYSGEWSAEIIHLNDYTNSNIHKTYLSESHFQSTATTTSFSIQMKVGILENTAAVTSITYGTANGSSFASGTKISLYGIKAA